MPSITEARAPVGAAPVGGGGKSAHLALGLSVRTGVCAACAQKDPPAQACPTHTMLHTHRSERHPCGPRPLQETQKP